LRVADRIFFVTVNLRRSLTPFTAAEYALILESFQESRRRLGFLLSYPLLVATTEDDSPGKSPRREERSSWLPAWQAGAERRSAIRANRNLDEKAVPG